MTLLSHRNHPRNEAIAPYDSAESNPEQHVYSRIVKSLHAGDGLREDARGVFVHSDGGECSTSTVQNNRLTQRNMFAWFCICDSTVRRMICKQRKLSVLAWLRRQPADQPTTSEARMLSQSDTWPTCREIELDSEVRDSILSKRGAECISDDDSSDDDGLCTSSSYSGDKDTAVWGSLPETPGPVETDSPYFSILPSLVTQALRAWKSILETRSQDLAVQEQATKFMKPASVLRSSPLQLPIRLRSGAGDDDHSYEVDSGQTVDTAIVDPFPLACSSQSNYNHGKRNKSSVPSRDLLACPFYVFDPERFYRCLMAPPLTDTRAVRTHASFDHYQPEHCPICYAIFDRSCGSDAAADRDRHIVARVCRPLPPPPGLLVGATEDQIDQLSHLGRRGGRQSTSKRRRGSKMDEDNDEEASWFQIWDILFPCEPRPASAYLVASHERKIADMWRFWKQAGYGLISDSLQECGLWQWGNERQEAVLASLHTTVFQEMVKASGLVHWASGGRIPPQQGSPR